MPHHVLIANSKGGCGKTTLSTNLCAYFTSQGVATVLRDYDPQGSSLHWHQLRKGQSGLKPVRQVVDANKQAMGMTQSFLLRLQRDTEVVIMDTPAGLELNRLRELVMKADSIVIPVMPSASDIHAAAHFIELLLLQARAKSLSKRIGVVANRVRQGTDTYTKLKRFLNCLDLPFLAQIRDSQTYADAGHQGMGIMEMEQNKHWQYRADWQPLLDWLDQGIAQNQSVETLQEVS